MQIMSDEEEPTNVEVQRLFGAGINRKRVDFVPAGTATESAVGGANRSTFTGDQYLFLVLKNDVSSSAHSKTDIIVSDA